MLPKPVTTPTTPADAVMPVPPIPPVGTGLPSLVVTVRATSPVTGGTVVRVKVRVVVGSLTAKPATKGR